MPRNIETGSKMKGPKLRRLALKDPRARLAKITIRSSGLERIAADLALCGIHETTLFPDLDSLSRELSDEWCD